MKVPRFIASVQIQNQHAEMLKISLGFERNGAMRLCFQDTVELGQDSGYINENSFPNSGSMLYGKYSMWVSMFTRHTEQTFDCDDG